MKATSKIDSVEQKAVRYLKKHAGVFVGLKELVNVCDCKPEQVKDAITHLTSVECLPIKVRGSTYAYANSKVRRNINKAEPEVVQVDARKGASVAPRTLNGELERIRESLLELAAKVDELDTKIKQGSVVIPVVRNAAAEGAALRAIREERGVERATMAKWMDKTEPYIAQLEDGQRAMTDAEAREFVKELRMDAAVFNLRLGGGKPVFGWVTD